MRLLLNWILLALVALQGFASAKPVDEARREIQSQYNVYAQAMERNQLKGSIDGKATDYTYTLLSGNRYNLQEMKLRREAAIKQGQKVRCRARVIRVSLQGDTAISHVLVHSEWELPGLFPGTGRRGTSDDLVQDVWSRTDGVWKTHQSLYLSSIGTTDGKKQNSKIGYTRTLREKRVDVSFDTQIARFASRRGQVVDLVAVLPIGEAAYYRKLRRELKDYDAVLCDRIAPVDGQWFLPKLLKLEEQSGQFDYKAKGWFAAYLDSGEPGQRLGKRELLGLMRAQLEDTVKNGRPATTTLQAAIDRVSSDVPRDSDRALVRRLLAKTFEDDKKLTASLSGSNLVARFEPRNRRAIALMESQLRMNPKKLALLYPPAQMAGLEERFRKSGFELQLVRFIPGWDLKSIP